MNNLGVAYLNQQRFKQALDYFEKAATLNGGLAAARLNQGIALMHLQRYDESRALLLAVTEKQPRNARAWFNLGLLYKSRGEAEPALQAFERVARLDPDDPDTHYFRGLLHAQRQSYEAAIDAYQQALRLNPSHASAEFGLATAYQRTGDAERTREHLSRFQHLTQNNLGFPLGAAYGDQGKYSTGEEVVPPQGAVPPAMKVQFVPVTGKAGIDFVHGRGGTREAGGAAAIDDFAPGACFLDYDNDGRQDILFVNSGPDAPSKLYRNKGKGRFIDATDGARLNARGNGRGCTAGDYDNDGWTDVAISFDNRVALFRNQGDGTFHEVSQEAGLQVSGLGITFVDCDHDGDLDLYLVRSPDITASPGSADVLLRDPSPGNVLWRNNGNGTFRQWTEPTGLESVGPGIAAVATDFNNDRAVDLVLTGTDNPFVLLNPREGKFQRLVPWLEPMPSPTTGVVVFDFDKDGWMDLAFTHHGPPGLTLWRNLNGQRAERVALPESSWTRGWGLAAVDYDNDGWIDLAAVGETGERGEIRLLRNRGLDGFEDRSEEVGLGSLKLKRPRALLTADYDQDGDTDLLLTQNGGPAVLLRNDGGNKNNWVRVALRGLADNKSAVGTKVEIFAGALQQKWEVPAASGYLGQNALEVVAGLGGADEVDIVRLLWPTGVVQDEVLLAAGRAHRLTEIDRRGSSCPILFAWNGERFEFITDVIGAGIVGHWVAPGVRNVSDPTEYVKVEEGQLRVRDGRLSLRLLEPMEELVYLDHVRLLAVDHPPSLEVYPNEYFAGAPPFPEFKVIASRGARPVVGAWDDRGREVTAQLQQRDRRYVEGFTLQRFKGFAELHRLELDLGEFDARKPVRLLMHGFVDYFTATSVYAAHQAGVTAVLPYVEAQTLDGRWIRVIDNMGFPAGLARTMVADLSGRLPGGTRRIRIVTNLQIYWDQILVDTTEENVPVRLSEVPLTAARVGFHGYPRMVEGAPAGDLAFIYEETSATGPYARHVGAYTGYGNVRELLREADDRFTIFGSGEEVALEFDAQTLPPLPPGWRRDWFFYADGFAKDMDFYEAYSGSVGPLPFHSMSRYPYPEDENYPENEAYLQYQLEYNQRQVSGRGVHSFRFERPQ